jgi:hypothetical protein
VSHLIVHHSAGTNSASDWAAIVRAIWDFHVNGNGWGDESGDYWRIKFTDTDDQSHTVEGDMSKTVMDGHTGTATVEYFSKLVTSDEGIEAGDATLSVNMQFVCL